MKKEDIKTKIDKLQALIDNPNVSEDDKKNLREGIEKFKDKLDSEKKEETDKPVVKKTTSVKPKAKPKAKPTATPTTEKKCLKVLLCFLKRKLW